MSDQESRSYSGLSEEELQGQEAHNLPDREVMSLLGGASTPVPLPATSTLPGLDAQGLDTQAYPGADAAGGSTTTDLPAYSTSDTNSVQTTTSATDTDPS
ncbi:MAG: hypothetical protein M3437_12195 [Chloroflexota bacterium]|nr:hypothetical protein [Chloroflexota bacterium]MDQ5864991.1 hypothetical protein [Chloroflexota bacterium]